MPFRSDKQRRAMFAAAKGKSTVGIPKKAAQEFIAHSTGTKSRLKEAMSQRKKRKP
jgi:hypothetical protein